MSQTEAWVMLRGGQLVLHTENDGQAALRRGTEPAERPVGLGDLVHDPALYEAARALLRGPTLPSKPGDVVRLGENHPQLPKVILRIHGRYSTGVIKYEILPLRALHTRPIKELEDRMCVEGARLLFREGEAGWPCPFCHRHTWPHKPDCGFPDKEKAHEAY